VASARVAYLISYSCLARLPKSEIYEMPYDSQPRKELPLFENYLPLNLVLWTFFIKEYRSRAPTKPVDRIMAIAGVARAIHNIQILPHLAGL
jgi:hypothetical protein